MNIYNYNHLFYFYVAAKLNGVTVAAKHLRTSQSSLSTQIKTLESQLGRPLFKKVGRKVELTDFGKEVFHYCRRSFEVFDEMFDQINKKKTSMGVRITIGVSFDIEKPFITDILSQVSKQFSKDQRPLLNLISLPSANLMQLLKVGEVDLLLTTHPVADPQLDIVDQFDFPVKLFIKNGSPGYSKNMKAEEVLRNTDLPFVLPSALHSLRSEIDKYFIRKKVNPVCVFESNVISSVIRAATDGAGATILPEIYLSRELRSEKFHAVDNKPLWKHRMSLLSTRQGLDEGRKIFASKLAEQLTHLSQKSSENN